MMQLKNKGPSVSPLGCFKISSNVLFETGIAFLKHFRR